MTVSSCWRLGRYQLVRGKPRVVPVFGRTVAVLFALGLMAKPQIITFPFVLLLWDYWPLQADVRSRECHTGMHGTGTFRKAELPGAGRREASAVVYRRGQRMHDHESAGSKRRGALAGRDSFVAAPFERHRLVCEVSSRRPFGR